VNRGWRVLVVASILAVLVGLVAVGMWQLEARGISQFFVTGVAFLGLGAVLTALNLTLSDDYIRRHEWEPGKDQLRQLVRRGWFYLMLLGGAFIGLHYLDRWMLAGRNRGSKEGAARVQLVSAFLTNGGAPAKTVLRLQAAPNQPFQQTAPARRLSEG
jgi:hypothetical protein